MGSGVKGVKGALEFYAQNQIYPRFSQFFRSPELAFTREDYGFDSSASDLALIIDMGVRENFIVRIL